jgi:hypothetical protein
MKQKLRNGVSLAAMAALALTMGTVSGTMAEARNKSGKMDPPQPESVAQPAPDAPSVERNKSGRLDPPDPSVERNKSGRLDPPDPSVERNKSGRLDPTVESTDNDPCKRPGTLCDPRDGGASTARNKSGRLDPTVERRAHSGPGGTPPNTALLAIGALAVVGGVVAIASGGSPSSP